MFPEESQTVMAKVLFCVVAILMMFLVRARAAELPVQVPAPVVVSFSR